MENYKWMFLADELSKDLPQAEEPVLRKLREAISEELSAWSTYAELKELMPEQKAIIEEIEADEINHTGRLIQLLLACSPKSQQQAYAAGGEQREPD